MAVTLQGLVYYADDPTRSAFRLVYPTEKDEELDDPRWTTEGLDPLRIALLIKVPVNSVNITPWATPSSTIEQNVAALAATVPAVVEANNAVFTAIHEVVTDIQTADPGIQMRDITSDMFNTDPRVTGKKERAGEVLLVAQSAAAMAAALPNADPASIYEAAQTAAESAA